MNCHITAQYGEGIKGLCDDTTVATPTHREQGVTRMARDEDDVNKVIAFTSNQNPFDLDTVLKELVNITTGLVPSPEVASSLGLFLNEAKKQNTDFVKKRVLENEKSKNF